MSILPLSRINEYARKMGVVLKKHPAGPKVLDPLAQYIDDTDMCGGYIVTSGKNGIQRREGYKMNQTHLYIAHRADDQQIIGFVMFTTKFIKSHHNDINIDHPNFRDKTKKISFILDICAAPVRNSARRQQEKTKKLKSVHGIKGVGTLLMLLALSQSGEDGAVLFVSYKPKVLHIKSGNIDRIHPNDVFYSTPSGLAFYDKMDFEVVMSYDRKGNLLSGAQIRYRDYLPSLPEADAIMRKYTGSASRPSKQPHRARIRNHIPLPFKPNIADSPASSVSSGRMRSPVSPGGIQVRKRSSAGRRDSPGAVLEYLREMKQAGRSPSLLPPPQHQSPGGWSQSPSPPRYISPGNRSRSPSPGGRSRSRSPSSRSRSRSRSMKSRSSQRTPSARSQWSRTPSARSSSSRTRSVRSNRSSARRPPHPKPRRKPAEGIYCGDKNPTPRGRPRGTPRSCFTKGMGIGYNLGRNGGRSPVHQFGSRSNSHSRSHSKKRRPSRVSMKGKYYGTH